MAALRGVQFQGSGIMARSKSKHRYNRPNEPGPKGLGGVPVVSTSPAEPSQKSNPPFVPPSSAPPTSTLPLSGAAQKSAPLDASQPTQPSAGVLAKLDSMVSLLQQQIDEQSAQLDSLMSARHLTETRIRDCEEIERRLQQAEIIHEGRVKKLRLWVRRLRELRDRTKLQRHRIADKIRLQSNQRPNERQIAELSAQLQTARNELIELASQRHQAASYAEELAERLSEETRAREIAQQRCEQAQEELQALLTVVDELKSCSMMEAECNANEDLLERLNNTLARCEELEIQNQELAHRVAKEDVRRADTSGYASMETLSWEERKASMMHFLESECRDQTSAKTFGPNRVPLEAWIEQTEAELQAKDHEIEELKHLLSEQSNANNGVAIGAAAFAQMIDSDEIIQEERAKLKELQEQWEQKLRQAEIEMSLERARLARERSEVEQTADDLRRKLQDLELQKSWGGDSETVSAKPPVRRWLAQLGLHRQ